MIVYSDAYLQSLRQVTDPLADQAVAALLAGGDLNQVNNIFSSLVRNDGIPEFAGYDISAYLNESARLPAGIDWGRIATAQQVFLQFGPTIFLVLFCQSLPECYACRRGAEVLYRTGRLTNTTDDYRVYARRLMETAQYVVNVMAPDGLKEHGQGIVTSQKVRLLHASIRNYLRRGGWDEEDLGAPINHEDMLGTMLSFSVTILEGIDKLGAHLNTEQQDAYYYLWTVAGQLMGIHPSHIPSSLDDAKLLKKRILEHQMAPSEAGKVLTRAAIDYMAYMIPGEAFDAFPERLMDFLLDRKVVETVGLKSDSGLGGRIAMAMLRFTAEAQSHLGNTRIFQSAAKAYEVKLMDAIFEHYNGHKQIRFYIPPSLQAAWQPENERAAAPRRQPGQPGQPEPKVLAVPSPGKRVEFPVESCHDVVPQLERLIGMCKVENNPIGFFASLYRLTTIRIVGAVDAGEFRDNQRMACMDLTFAKRYLDAVAAHFNGEPTSAAWKVAFEGAANPDLNVIQHLLLGMNAHINLDLCVAAAETAPGDRITSFQQDFMKINGILKSLMDLTAHDIARIWPPLKEMLLVGEWAGKPLAGLLMVRERDRAWEKAVRLAALTGQDLQSAISGIDDKTARMGEEVIHPGWLAGDLFKAVRKAEKGDVRWQIEQFHSLN